MVATLVLDRPLRELGSPRDPPLRWDRVPARRTILLVEDDPDIRENVEALLQDAGFEVVVATNGLEARHMLDRGLTPTALVLDLMMPVMSGFELFETLAPHQRKRVVVMTASNIGFVRAFAYVPKPLSSDDLAFLCRPPFVKRQRTEPSPVKPVA